MTTNQASHSSSPDSLSSDGKQDNRQDEIQIAPSYGNGVGGTVQTEEYVSETQRAAQAGRVSFRLASLWEPAVINPINGKSYTFPILRFWDPYAIAFWMATLGFFSAFFSWFAFAPLVTEAVKVDLNLTQTREYNPQKHRLKWENLIEITFTFAEITNSNLASLGGTALVRLVAGACVDRWGPRKVMAALLCLGAIPSALVPTVKNIGGLETVRFFISILGGTFVMTQAWTTTFFDKTIVGTANAFSGGWGNLGGGVTPAVMM